MCSFYAVGKCLRGENCKFAHSLSQIRQKPDFTRTSLCHDWMRKRSCKNGDKCRYAHGEKELQAHRPELQEPELAWDPIGLKEVNEVKVNEAATRPSSFFPLMEKLMSAPRSKMSGLHIPTFGAPLNEDTFNAFRDLSVHLSPRSCGGLGLRPLGVVPGRREKVHFRALDRYLSSVVPMAPSDPCKVPVGVVKWGRGWLEGSHLWGVNIQKKWGNAEKDGRGMKGKYKRGFCNLICKNANEFHEFHDNPGVAVVLCWFVDLQVSFSRLLVLVSLDFDGDF